MFELDLYNCVYLQFCTTVLFVQCFPLHGIPKIINIFINFVCFIVIYIKYLYRYIIIVFKFTCMYFSSYDWSPTTNGDLSFHLLLYPHEIDTNYERRKILSLLTKIPFISFYNYRQLYHPTMYSQIIIKTMNRHINFTVVNCKFWNYFFGLS